MKKVLILLFLILFCSLSVSAAKYKVNSSGKVVAPNGNVQSNSSVLSPGDVYKNYSSNNYVQNQQVLASAAGTIDIIMDYSGSMSFWIESAKNSMRGILAQIPNSVKIGFRVFGHDGGNNPYSPIISKVNCISKNKKGGYSASVSSASYLGYVSGSCSATTQVAKIAPNNISYILNGMNSVRIGGSTPLTLALDQAVNYDFAKLSKIEPKKIILITDGGENCGGDPCAFAKSLVAKRKDITIDVVLVSSNSRALVCLSDTTGGKFYNTNDPYSFSNILIESMQDIPNNVQNESEPSQKYEYIP